jgi:transglutaminase-like putative cysteine protease
VFTIAPNAHSYPFSYTESDLLDLGVLRNPLNADPVGKLAAWAKGFILSDPTDTLSLLKDINGGVLAPLTYRVRDEEGTQTPLETLALKSGSCRDIAALFIEAVRHLGFGARAVSGYLLDPTAPPDTDGSTHAWAEVYLPSAGWIAFDPTHGRVGSLNLVPSAVGRSNQQIMPVTGGYLGAADDFQSMDVLVQVVGQ